MTTPDDRVVGMAATRASPRAVPVSRGSMKKQPCHQEGPQHEDEPRWPPAVALYIPDAGPDLVGFNDQAREQRKIIKIMNRGPMVVLEEESRPGPG